MARELGGHRDSARPRMAQGHERGEGDVLSADDDRARADGLSREVDTLLEGSRVHHPVQRP